MKDVLKTLWEAWKECHNEMVEREESGEWGGDVLGKWCDEIKEMMMWIVENVEMECDDEIDGIVDMLFGRRKSE